MVDLPISMWHFAGGEPLQTTNWHHWVILGGPMDVGVDDDRLKWLQIDGLKPLPHEYGINIQCTFRCINVVHNININIYIYINIYNYI